MNSDKLQQTPTLGEQDRQLVDRLFMDGLDATVERGTPRDERERRLHDLLGLLGSPVVGEEHREARTDLIEVMSRRVERATDAEPLLCRQDRQACDAYIESGYDPSGVPEALADRAARLERMGALLTAGRTHPEDRERLIESTLGAIQAHIDAEESAMKIQGRGGFQLPARWADLVSVAAVLLLVASVIMPILSGMRSAQHQEMCLDNMNRTANAFGLYTGANRDMLPMATAGFGPTWMDVGTTPDRSNSSNLYTLVRNQFARLDDLACPSNPDAATGEPDPDAWDWKSHKELSYSYRIMPRGGIRASSVDQPVRVVLLADRSPVVLRIKLNQAVIPEENSPNHNHSGQHMLMLDGSARWSDTPMLESRDNIWLPRPLESVIHQVRERYGIMTGNEQPDGPTDAFVGP